MERTPVKVINTSFNPNTFSYKKLNLNNTTNNFSPTFEGLPNKLQLNLFRYFNKNAPKNRKDFYNKTFYELGSSAEKQFKRELYKYIMCAESLYLKIKNYFYPPNIRKIVTQ